MPRTTTTSRSMTIKKTADIAIGGFFIVFCLLILVPGLDLDVIH